MNRLRGSVDRDAALKIGEMLDAHGVAPYEPFWKGYRDATRELGLMIRVNGLPLALAIAIDKAGITGDRFSPPAAGEEKSGRARAVVDLAARLKPPTPERPRDLLTLVEETTAADRGRYNEMVETALASLLWQKTLSAARTKSEKEKQKSKEGREQ